MQNPIKSISLRGADTMPHSEIDISGSYSKFPEMLDQKQSKKMSVIIVIY